MRPEIKFCGLTRVVDVGAAVDAGARYVGVVFARGPRTVTPEAASELLRRVPSAVSRVGVFGPELEPDAVAHVARAAGLDIVQLHGDPDGVFVDRVRRVFGGPVWAALRVQDASVPGLAAQLFQVADAVVLDAYSPTSLGGTGLALPWNRLAESLRSVRGPGRLVLAGGLRPDTVAGAVRVLRPDVVDVSSGVESAPGIKDHAKLRAFREAVEREVTAT